MAECVVDRRTLETAMRHAVVTSRILADSVLIPLGVIDQRLVARRIPLVGVQGARALPTEDVVGGIAPWRALVGLVTGEEIQGKRGVIARPRDAGGASGEARDEAR